jgi:hypothetical protein
LPQRERLLQFPPPISPVLRLHNSLIRNSKLEIDEPLTTRLTGPQFHTVRQSDALCGQQWRHWGTRFLAVRSRRPYRGDPVSENHRLRRYTVSIPFGWHKTRTRNPVRKRQQRPCSPCPASSKCPFLHGIRCQPDQSVRAIHEFTVPMSYFCPTNALGEQA